MNTNKNYKIMIIGGCFDILHPGHLDFLTKAKKMSDYLIVLLEPDEKIKMLKGNTRPINNETVRVENLEKTGLIDKVILLPTLTTSEEYEKMISKIVSLVETQYIASHNQNYQKVHGVIGDNLTNAGETHHGASLHKDYSTIYFGLTRNDRNTKKNENIKKLGEKMNIEVLEVNKLIPKYSTSKILTNTN